MFSEKWKKEIITIPNILSLLRIALIPVYAAIYFGGTDPRRYLWAGTILTLSCLTDLADGIIARKCHQITDVGKILDPLADKLTQFTLILSLSAKYSALYPVLGLFLAKELFQCGALLFFAQQGKVLSGALWAGKVCTTGLFVSLILLVLFPELSMGTVLFLTWVDTGFLLFSFCSYLLAYFGNRNCLTDWNQS